MAGRHVCRDDLVGRCRKVCTSLLVGEQIDVFARSLQDAVCGHGVAAGECETVGATDPQPDLGKTAMRRLVVLHYAAECRWVVS